MKFFTNAKTTKKPTAKPTDIRFRMPDKYYFQIRDMAEKKGIPVGTLARMMLIERLNGEAGE